MPDVRCQNGHEYHFHNTRGSKAAGRPCPECGEPLRGVTAGRCNKLGYYQATYSPGHTFRGRCSEPKGHETAHKAFGHILSDTPETAIVS